MSLVQTPLSGSGIPPVRSAMLRIIACVSGVILLRSTVSPVLLVSRWSRCQPLSGSRAAHATRPHPALTHPTLTESTLAHATLTKSAWAESALTKPTRTESTGVHSARIHAALGRIEVEVRPLAGGRTAGEACREPEAARIVALAASPFTLTGLAVTFAAALAAFSLLSGCEGRVEQKHQGEHTREREAFLPHDNTPEWVEYDNSNPNEHIQPCHETIRKSHAAFRFCAFCWSSGVRKK